MADVQHADLTGASLHETKGADSAGSNTVHQANGSGATSWAKVGISNINTSSIKQLNKKEFTYTIDTINTAASYYLVIPYAGSISKIWSVIDGSFTGSNTILSFEINNVAVTNGNITITQSGSAAGDVDSSTPTAANTLTAGQALEIICDGGATSDVKCTLTIELDIT
jgi:hypothetical protein